MNWWLVRVSGLGIKPASTKCLVLASRAKTWSTSTRVPLIISSFTVFLSIKHCKERLSSSAAHNTEERFVETGNSCLMRVTFKCSGSTARDTFVPVGNHISALCRNAAKFSGHKLISDGHKYSGHVFCVQRSSHLSLFLEKTNSGFYVLKMRKIIQAAVSAKARSVIAWECSSVHGVWVKAF